MASYKHEKENLGYPITSIETEKDTSDVPEELEGLDKPVKQSPGYSRVFEFDAILSSFIYKKSQEEKPASTDNSVNSTTNDINIDKSIDEVTKDIDWKNVDKDKDKIKEYIKKSIEKVKDPDSLKDYEHLKQYIEKAIKHYIQIHVPVEINTPLQIAIDKYSDFLSIDEYKEKEKEKEKGSILEKIKNYWTKFKEEWPIDKINLTQYLSDDIKKAIKVLNDTNIKDLQTLYDNYSVIASIAPIQLDNIYVFLFDTNVLHYISSDRAIQVGTIPVKVEDIIKSYPVLMNEKGQLYVPISKKSKPKTERGLYKVKKGTIIFFDSYRDFSDLKEGEDWMRLPVDLFVNRQNAIHRHRYYLIPNIGERKPNKEDRVPKTIYLLYQVRNENPDVFSHDHFYVEDKDLLPVERQIYSNLSEIPWISRDFSNSPETPISNSPIEEPGNPYYQSTHNSVVDYLAMPNVGDTLGERRIDRGYSGDAEYQDKDYIKLYKEKKKEELKNKVKKHPYYSFFLERDLI